MLRFPEVKKAENRSKLRKDSTYIKKQIDPYKANLHCVTMAISIEIAHFELFGLCLQLLMSNY